MARFAAYLYGAGGALVLGTLLAPRPAHAQVLGIAGPAVLALITAVVLIRMAERIPMAVFHAVPVGGSVLITIAAWSSHEAGIAYSLLYVWAALYSFYFLSWLDAGLQILLIATAYGLVLARAGPFAVGEVHLVMMLGTVVIAALWVRSVVRQLRDHAAELSRTGQELASAEQRLAQLVGQLQTSNRRLEQFASVAARDLQQPLRAVSGHIRSLERHCRGSLGGDADEYLAFAAEGAARMDALVTDLLTYSRIGQGPSVRLEVEAGSCLASARARLRGQITASHAQLVCQKLPRVVADPEQLTQLFVQLLANAIKFCTASPPRIEVSAIRGVSGPWIVSVRDNGIGIDSQQRERIFAVFQRLNLREDFPGTGIGLAICRKIVERHGGRIWVESATGGGSVFRFALPDPAEVRQHTSTELPLLGRS